jgi:hypothetical protein
MTAPFVMPFNFQPSATGRSATNYTVPAGKYAYVRVSASVTATFSAANLANSDIAVFGSYDAQSGADSQTYEFWLVAGDAVSFTTSTASGNAAITYGTTNIYDAQTATSTATISINSLSVAVVSATATASISFDAAASGNSPFTYGTFAGAATVLIFYAEYNNIT